MVARFQRHVGCGAVGRPSFFFGIVYGHLFRMQPAKVVVPTLGNHGTVLDQDATHQGVGTYLSSATLCDQKSVLHEHAIGVRPLSAHASATDRLFKTACIPSTGVKATKSSDYS